MSEIKSQFFNGKTYSATDFAESNKNTMLDGILPYTEYFKVLPASNRTIGVTAGRGWVQGHAFSSDSTLSFTLDNADGVLDRIDTVIIRLDLTTDNEKIECKVIKGTLGGGATAPVRDGTYYDLVIAQIAVARGTTAITAGMITDKRGDSNLCGWAGAISSDQFNFEELRNSKADKTSVAAALVELVTICSDHVTTLAGFTSDTQRYYMTSAYIPPSVTAIGDYWFSRSPLLKLMGCANVSTIGSGFLMHCYSLTAISLPRLATVGDNFGWDCSGLATVILPSLATAGAFFAGYCPLTHLVVGGVNTLTLLSTNTNYFDMWKLPVADMVAFGTALKTAAAPTTLKFGAVYWNALTTEQKIIFTSKNYTIATV